MNKSIIFLALLTLFCSVVVQGQNSVMETPGRYMMPMDRASESFPGKEKGGELWIVFSDRPNNPLYADRSCRTPSGGTLDFMHPMYVIDESETTIRVVEISDADSRGNLLENAKDNSAWVKKDDMLLWSTCLKTRDVNLPGFKGGIFNKKAMVLNIISSGQKVLRAPGYYSHPRCYSGDSINSALVYQINYVYKETDNAYLLGDVPEIRSIERDLPRIRGWVLKSQTTAWNHRLAYEVNWDTKAVQERKNSGNRAQIFSNKGLTGSPVFEENFNSGGRMIGEADRFPVLDVYNGVSKVGVIGELKSQNGQTLSSYEFAHIKHVIDSMSCSLRNVNIIFVIDATSSMVPYAASIQKALTGTMRTLLRGQNNYRFGATLYRDAQEGNSNVLHYSRDFTSNYNQINTLLRRYMSPTFNRCNTDPEEAVFYGIKRAVERFDPPVGESNFVILIGDAGNHNRTTFTDCNGKTEDDFTNISHSELVDLLVRKNINLFAIQAHHQVASDVKPVYDSFRTQVEKLMADVAIRRTTNNQNLTAESVINRQGKSIIEIDDELGVPGYFKLAPDGGSLHPSVLTRDITNELNIIDDRVNKQLESISMYLNGKLNGSNVKQIDNFIQKLKENNISSDKLDIVFQKSGQLYTTGYTRRHEPGLKNPVYQDVLLMSQEDLYSIKHSLERLIPTDALALPKNESRSFIVYGWYEILIDILGYFPENNNEIIDTLSLYTLSAILTGWGGKEKYKDIKLIDVTMPDRFSDVMLCEYLIDWCVTKGHVQSIYDGQNMLTGDYFEDHMWTIFYEYLYNLTEGRVSEDQSLKQKFTDYYKKYDKEYNNFRASFRIPMGTGNGLKHFWIDSRIFPHSAKEFGETGLIETLYEDYMK
ncbi:MAG: hypothetical protein K9H26_15680 [Prolixibacteraceae bacterium]|nr:hypothetical protein [Prolixibacteraceae bacterium]